MRNGIKEIISSIKQGDQQAFKKLVEHYQQYAFSLSFRILANEEDAKDVVQDSFIKIWKKIKEFDVELNFKTWMYKIVTHTAIDKMRQRSRFRAQDISDSAESIQNSFYTNLEKQLDNKEAAELITVIGDGLSEKQRLVFIMRDIEGMESGEVQSILDMPETAVKSNLYHARKAIREKLHQINAFERRMK